MRHDGGKLAGLLTVLVIGQAAIIATLFSRQADADLVIPPAARIVESAAERDDAEAEQRERLGARRRASRLAAVERGLAEARSTVRELRGLLEDAELAHADLERERAEAASRFEAELASARSGAIDWQGAVDSAARHGMQPEMIAPVNWRVEDGKLVMDATGVTLSSLPVITSVRTNQNWTTAIESIDGRADVATDFEIDGQVISNRGAPIEGGRYRVAMRIAGELVEGNVIPAAVDEPGNGGADAARR